MCSLIFLRTRSTMHLRIYLLNSLSLARLLVRPPARPPALACVIWYELLLFCLVGIVCPYVLYVYLLIQAREFARTYTSSNNKWIQCWIQNKHFTKKKTKIMKKRKKLIFSRPTQKTEQPNDHNVKCTEIDCPIQIALHVCKHNQTEIFWRVSSWNSPIWIVSWPLLACPFPFCVLSTTLKMKVIHRNVHASIGGGKKFSWST